VGFRGEVHDGVGLEALEQGTQFRGTAYVDLGEGVTRVPRRLRDRSEVRRISELVDVDDVRAGMIEQMAYHRRADEAGAACHEYGRAIEIHVVPFAAR
jgi:hypothetical protein